MSFTTTEHHTAPSVTDVRQVFAGLLIFKRIITVINSVSSVPFAAWNCAVVFVVIAQQASIAVPVVVAVACVEAEMGKRNRKMGVRSFSIMLSFACE